MVVNKYLILGILIPILIGFSFGLDWNVISDSNSILIYGYINEDKNTDINIQVKDFNGNIVWEGTPEFSSDYDTNTIMSGVFYKDINLDSGNYIVKVTENGNTYSKDILVNGTQNVNLKIVDISQDNENTIVRFLIEGNSAGKYTLYYKNGESTKEISFNREYKGEISIPNNNFGKNTIAILKFDSKDGNSTYIYEIFKHGIKILPKNFEILAENISIIRGKSGEFTFDVKNLNDYSINLNISYDSNLEVYGEQEITLQPKEEKEVSYSVNVPRYFNDTPYLKIILSNGNYKEEKEVNVNILPFDGFNLSYNFKKQYLPDEIIDSNVIVKNIGDNTKNIQFSYEVFGNKYIFPYKVSLNPGESFSFPVSIQIPNDQTTDFNIKFFVNDEEFDKTIQVTPYIYDFSTNIDNSNLNILSGNNKKISLIIENDGNIEGTYKILVNGWKFYTLDKNKISILPGEKKEINLEIMTNKDMKMGNYQFNISVSNGIYTRYNDISLFIDKPEIEQSNISFSGKEMEEFSSNKTFNYTLKISNLGIEDKEYLIKVSEFNITKDVYLSPNETKKVVIGITPIQSKDYKFNMTVFSNGVEIWNKGLKLEYTKNKITGAFIMAPKEASVVGLVALSILGGAALGLYIGEKVKIKVNKEKAVVSNDYR